MGQVCYSHRSVGDLGLKTEWLKEESNKYERTTKSKPGGYSASLAFKIH